LSELFSENATATAQSAIDILRRQIGKERVNRLLIRERERSGKNGGVRLSQDVKVSDTGIDTVNLDPEGADAMNQDRTGQAKRQRAKFESDDDE
jgi:hypothetical protein